jgi:probable F420-dependent oxidoreductase
VGITLPQAGQQATRENVVRMAQNAEKEGFDSLWVFERLLWPINPQTPYPGAPDGSLPIESQNVFDPLETLTYVAAHTDRITLGTSVIDMLFHNPVILARRLATLDVLSEGRTICGLGIGWSKDEYQVSNIPYKERGKRADEFIQTLKRIWTDDVVEFKGKFYNIPPSKIRPKPVQKPGIPIYLGGFSPNTFARIIRYDLNGWLGVVGGPLEYIENTIKSIKGQASQVNKNPDNFQIVVAAYPNVTEGTSSKNAEKRFPFSGRIDEIRTDIERIKHMGIDHIIFGSIGKDLDKVMDITKLCLPDCNNE